MDASLRSKAEELASEIASQAKTAEDLQGLMGLMMKSALERMLDTEMDVHLGRKTVGGLEPQLVEAADDARPSKSAKRSPNRRNGRSKKTVQGDLGELTHRHTA